MPKRLSAFMIFTKDWQRENRPNMSLPKAIIETGKIWQEMSKEDRRPYHERSSSCSVLRTDGKQALNSYGTPLAHLVAEKKSEEDEVIKMKRDIDHKVRVAMNNKDLETQRFNIIMFNYFNKTENGDSYLPAEISICQFSLQEGIVKYYFRLLNPDTVVFGSLYDAQQHALHTHGLPLPPKALGTTDMRQVYLDVLEFIDDDNEYGILPPVYTFTDQMPLVSSCLRYINASAPEEPEIRVFSIHYLFYQMKCATSELAGLPTPKNQFVTNSQFDHDHFEYHSGLGCEFHEEEDRSKYCAKSRVIRWCYLFFDYMCADLAIPLIPSKHFPERIKPNFIVGKPIYSIEPSNSKPGKTVYSIDPDDNNIDYSSKLEAMKIGSSVTTTSAHMQKSLKSSHTADKGRPVKSLSAVLHDVTKFGANINDNVDFPVLSSKKKKPKNTNSNSGGALPPTKGELSFNKEVQPMLNETGSDDSIVPKSTYSFGQQSMVSSSVSEGAGRGYGNYASTISKLSGKSKNKLNGAGRGWAL